MNRKLIIRDKPNITQYDLMSVEDRILWGDALKILKKLPSEAFDLVFVDPPYFLQLPKRKLRRWSGTLVEGVNEDWDKFDSFSDYDAFTKVWLAEIKRLMKPKATIWVIGTYHNIHRIGKLMQDMGYWILNHVIWVKTNPTPNFLGVRFTNATETLIWATKDKNTKGYTFHRDLAKEFGIGKIGANVWMLPICNGNERLRDENGKKIHPTQKPAELLKRIILTTTNEDDIILDPFAGTGTTGVVAKEYGRHFVMIEAEEKYVRAIERRLKNGIQSHI